MFFFRPLLLTVLVITTISTGRTQEPPPVTPPDPESNIPASLKPWVGWALHNTTASEVPRDSLDHSIAFPVWASRLQFDATRSGATFSVRGEAFDETWLALPGSDRIWPIDVQIDGEPIPVVERQGRPTVRVSRGDFTLRGSFTWPELPQQIQLPPSVGLLELTVEGKTLTNPSWKADGALWLQRQASSEPVDEDFLSVKIHSLLEDGIPLWFETHIDLIVAGKSREETLGTVLPQGWELASIEAPIPVAIDERGLLKAQLRAGRWSISLRAFQTSDIESIAFAEGTTPAVPDQTLSYRPQTDFRQAEITGLPQIDVAQTQVPENWRNFPVYRWNTSAEFQLEERVRGAGERGPAPLRISRSLWLDDDGETLTYQDSLTGSPRKIRRLDAAAGHRLGSVTVEGEPQLITHNPDGGTPGFEVRTPTLTAVATGRLTMDERLPATGWKSDAESLGATLQLPPGYRLLAIFGVDYSRGDWLTSWTLLDLFLLLLFTMAVFRLSGFRGAAIALIAFGLAYHEPGSPRLPWLFLLIPVALVAYMPEGRWKKVMVGVKWGFAVILLLFLLPFVSRQIQGAIFPQLEQRAAYSMPTSPSAQRESAADYSRLAVSSAAPSKESNFKEKKANLKADPKAIIQTGPGVPDWSWRTIEFGWEGPVSASQQIRPVLIPPLVSRTIGVLRVIGLFALAILLLSVRRRDLKPKRPTSPPATPAAALLVATLFLGAFPGTVSAQFPDSDLLKELQQRLTDAPDAFPGAVEIGAAEMRISGDAIELSLEYHAAARSAAPVPFPLNAGLPQEAIFSSGGPASLLRKDGKLWVLLPEAGIFRLSIAGRLRDLTDWEWGFALKPRLVEIDAEGWAVSGIRPDGSAEDQVLFSRAEREGQTTANYDRPDTRHALLVERTVELGLVWRVKTTVSRLSPTGRAVVLQVPILPGEKVVSSGRSVEDGAIEVRLTPEAKSVSWEGELAPTNTLTLSANEAANWTEQWRLIASSVWNVSFSGLSPTFIVEDAQLVPLWQPWPGESAAIEVSRPEAVAGAVVTIDSATHTMNPGRRQQRSTLELSLRTSLGEDFAIGLPTEAEIISLTHSGQTIPIRKEGDAVVVPLRPGSQSIRVEWKLANAPGGWTRVDSVDLPVECANVTTIIRPTQGRWLILTDGPLRGPAVRFWGVLAFIVVTAIILARIPGSPLNLREWLLLSLGLSQIPVWLSLIVVAWLFLIRWRGTDDFQKLGAWSYNFTAACLIFLTLFSFGIFIGIASAGLLGSPEMYVAGSGSTERYLKWFSARTAATLPEPGYVSLSIWWFRLAMLSWALWLSVALIRWVRRGWKNSCRGGHFRPFPKKSKLTPPTPPEVPKK